MIRGLYTATTGMLTQEKRMDVVVNNLANATTVGFKQDSLISSSFADLLIERINDPAIVQKSQEVGPFSHGIHVDEVATLFSPGAYQETQLDTDLALVGEGYFMVQTAAGERLTRAGNFQVDAAGYLVTSSGQQVLGQNGAVRIGQSDFSVDNAGNISVDGPVIETLRLVTVPDETRLRKEGGNLFSLMDGAATPTAAVQVRQGYLESSNVDLSAQMVNMIEIQRSYEINQRVVKIMDEKLGRGVNEIGKI